MLFASPESTCDVCLEPFSWTEDLSRPVADALKPHALGCGHIFCLSCLSNLRPSNCPLCRRPFSAERIKKLHIEPHDGGVGEDKISAAEQLIQLALVCKDHTPSREITRAIREAQSWTINHPDSSYCSHIETFLLFIRKSMEAAEKNSADRRLVSELESKLMRRAREAEDSEERFQAIEETLLKDNERLNKKLEETLNELNFWHNQFPGSRNLPPQIRATQSASATTATSGSNPLPAPPRPVDPNRFYQSYDTSSGSRTAYERSTIHQHQQPQMAYPKEATKQPGMYYTPGASWQNRVIPIQFEQMQDPSQLPRETETRPRGHNRERSEAEPRETLEERRSRFREQAQLKRIEKEEATRQRGDAIMPGNALGIDSMSGRSSPVLRTPIATRPMVRSMSYHGEENAEAGPSRVLSDPGVGSASTSVSMVPAPAGASSSSEGVSRPRRGPEGSGRRESLGPYEQPASGTRPRIPPPPIHIPYEQYSSRRRSSMDVVAPTPVPSYGPYAAPAEANNPAHASQSSVVSALNSSLDWDSDRNSSTGTHPQASTNSFFTGLRGLPGPQPADPPQPPAGQIASRELAPGERPAVIEITPSLQSSFSRSSASSRSSSYPAVTYAQQSAASSSDDRRSSRSSQHHHRPSRSRTSSTAAAAGRPSGFPYAPAPAPNAPAHGQETWPYRGASSSSSLQSVH